MRSDQRRNETAALKPIGFALAAVVAGLGTAKAHQADVHASSPTPAPNEPTASSSMLASFAPDDVLLLDILVDGSGNAVPLGEKAAPAAQADLFDPDVPLGRS